MRFSEALASLLSRHGLAQSYKASKALGVAQTNLQRFLSGTNRPTGETLYKIANRLDLSRDERIDIFSHLLRERLTVEVEAWAVWLFLAIADADERAAIIARLAAEGTTVSEDMLVPSLIATAEAKEPRYAQLREILTPFLIESVSLNLRQSVLDVVAGEEVTSLLRSHPQASDGKSTIRDEHLHIGAASSNG
jgi:transcriptional regulator with XRE-family HTH domain